MIRWLYSLLIFASAVFLIACGDGSIDNTPIDTAAPNNAVTIKVNAGIRGDYINGLFTSVRICTPNGPCFDIDNILVDTGSTGLRVLASAIPANSPNLTRAELGGKTIAECSQFVSGVMWGPKVIADIRMNGEIARGIPIHIIGDGTFSSIPAECSSKGPAINSIQTLSANGVLGISNFVTDCGPSCANNSNNGFYYACDTSACEKIAASEIDQIQNPIAHFAVNNNGSVIELPDVAGSGAPSTEGKLYFGINTQSNNQLSGAHSISLNPQTASFSTIYSGVNYSMSYFDSGSNGIYFDDLSIKPCDGLRFDGYYCPTTSTAMNVIFQGYQQEYFNYSFVIGNAENLLQNSTSNMVQPYLTGVAGGGGQDFVWGLPFYFGKKFFTAIENSPITNSGIFVAYR